LTLERVRLADVVSDAVAAADALALAKGVRLHGAEVDGAAHVSLDVAEVSRVLTNLLTNAIRHTPSDGTVAVSAHLSDATAVLAVADGCGGVPEQDLPRLFETGFRGETSRPPLAAAGGSGIGLAIVRGIVPAHGG
nr:HAMP domain-containing sensor histidine kinase [Micromonospora sp. DSM 115978]